MSKKRKYACIAKIGTGPQTKFVKYRTNNPEKFILFLVRKFPGAMWANFYFKSTGSIAGTWGKNKGLQLNFKP